MGWAGGADSQEFNVGILPLKKTTHLQERISDIYSLSSMPHRLIWKDRAPAVFLMVNKGPSKHIAALDKIEKMKKIRLHAKQDTNICVDWYNHSKTLSFL